MKEREKKKVGQEMSKGKKKKTKNIMMPEGRLQSDSSQMELFFVCGAETKTQTRLLLNSIGFQYAL